jgi:DNA replication protein DnaC
MATELVPILKRLKLGGVLETLDLRVRQAVEDGLDHHEFLIRLLQDEVERRESKALERRVKHAAFDGSKSLDDFDFTFNPNVPKARIIDLGTCRFIDRRENVVIIGPAGVGKSHIAQALGHRACRLGLRVLHTPAHQLLSELRAARADYSWQKRVERLATLDLLIIDDLGLRPLAYDEPVDLYEIIRRRYERGSTIITSNRAIEEWYPLFGDALLASSAMDRLLHHCEVVEMDGDSYRNPPTGRKR